ncbi:DUF4440 domain-containing protein [candidate division WOR-3 bacterium]|nr:DUF4440 domain-containing protein [candidate division WOR-3 bacterium]
MTKRLLVLSIAILAVFLVVAVVMVAKSQDAGDKGDFLKSIAAFYAAIEANDVEARIQLLSDDVIMMPNHWTMIRGKDAVSEMIQAAAAAVFNIRDREVVYIDISGDLAYTVNSYYYTYHARGQPEQWHKTKNVHIWRRDHTGLWKLSVDIWNSDVPLNQFAEE